MTSLHLLIEDDYIDEFAQALPKDKVRIVEKNFDENKQKLQTAFEAYCENNTQVKPLQNSMQDLKIWLDQKDF